MHLMCLATLFSAAGGAMSPSLCAQLSTGRFAIVELTSLADPTNLQLGWTDSQDYTSQVLASCNTGEFGR